MNTKTADHAVIDRMVELGIPSLSPHAFEALEDIAKQLRDAVTNRTYDLDPTDENLHVCHACDGTGFTQGL